MGDLVVHLIPENNSNLMQEQQILAIQPVELAKFINEEFFAIETEFQATNQDPTEGGIQGEKIREAEKERRCVLEVQEKKLLQREEELQKEFEDREAKLKEFERKMLQQFNERENKLRTDEENLRRQMEDRENNLVQPESTIAKSLPPKTGKENGHKRSYVPESSRTTRKKFKK